MPPRIDRQRIVFDRLIKEFPPPPYMHHRQVRAWLFDEVKRATKKHPDSIYHRWQLIWLTKWKWDKED